MNQSLKGCRLKIQQVHKTCLFDLSWGESQQLSATLEYPVDLTRLYQEWQRIYLTFYQSSLRGRVAEVGGVVSIPVDWQTKLIEAETKFLQEFYGWLRRAELFEIRAQIAKLATEKSESVGSGLPLGIFLTCTPLELARFPWETWEIGTEFAIHQPLQILRSPANVRTSTSPRTQGRKKARILAILGDETGLNFQGDRQAVRSLSPMAEIEFVGWQPGIDTAQLKLKICHAIADERGWDLLLFAGHSNETQLTGGELAIAPNVALSIREITPYLTVAKERGLQFALFNSCRGLNIAEALIDLGFSQVAIMREPIHNQVAQVFLLHFLQSLAQHRDVRDALFAATQFLKEENHLIYPSADLIPSLFCHPDSPLFQIPPRDLKSQLKKLLPTRFEAGIFAFFCLILLLPLGAESALLQWRILCQGIYRNLTNQVPAATTPPVLLIHIDNESIRRAGISDPQPMNRQYLASLIDQVVRFRIPIIGIDYVFDRQQPGNDSVLANSVKNAVIQQQTQFVFAAVLENGKEVGVAPETKIANFNWTMQGYVNARPEYVKLLPANQDCETTCPFPYLLALTSAIHQNETNNNFPEPKLTNFQDYRTNIINFSPKNPQSHFAFLKKLRLSVLSDFSRLFGQLWLRPIIDFSIPPNQVYDRVAAWRILTKNWQPNQPINQGAIAIIAAGGYDEAGLRPGADNFPVPFALAYWRKQAVPGTYPRWFTGSEAIAYNIHHLLTRRLVVPVPLLWMIPIAALLGKLLTLALVDRTQKQRYQIAIALFGLTGVYGLLTLQIYISLAILLPWFVPSLMVWLYILPYFRKKINA